MKSFTVFFHVMGKEIGPTLEFCIYIFIRLLFSYHLDSGRRVGVSVFFGNQKIAEQENSSSLLKMRKVYIPYIFLYDKCCITCSERDTHTEKGETGIKENKKMKRALSWMSSRSH